MSTVRLLSKTVKTNQKVVIEKPFVENNLDKKDGWKTRIIYYIYKIKNLGFEISYKIVNGEIICDFKDTSRFFSPSEEKRKEAVEFTEKLNVCLIKLNYVENNVNSKTVNNLSTNIITYTEGDDLFAERFNYYKELIATKNYKNREGVKRNDSEIELQEDFDLEEYIKYRGPVVVAQEGLGGGARCIYDCTSTKKRHYDWIDGFDSEKEAKKKKDGRCFLGSKKLSEIKGKYDFRYDNITSYKDEDEMTKYRFRLSSRTLPAYDIYDDRITKIYYDSNLKKTIIKEFNRANVDVSVKYWENIIREPKCRSTAEGVYDFIVGYSGTGTSKYFKLYCFSMNYISDITEPSHLSNAIKRYNSNSFSNHDYFNDNILSLGELRKAKDVKGKPKKTINLHKGTEGYNSSQGCFTIYSSDYSKFISSNDIIFKNNKLGLLFLFR